MLSTLIVIIVDTLDDVSDYYVKMSGMAILLSPLIDQSNTITKNLTVVVSNSNLSQHLGWSNYYNISVSGTAIV